MHATFSLTEYFFYKGMLKSGSMFRHAEHACVCMKIYTFLKMFMHFK